METYFNFESDFDTQTKGKNQIRFQRPNIKIFMEGPIGQNYSPSEFGFDSVNFWLWLAIFDFGLLFMTTPLKLTDFDLWTLTFETSIKHPSKPNQVLILSSEAEAEFVHMFVYDVWVCVSAVYSCFRHAYQYISRWSTPIHLNHPNSLLLMAKKYPIDLHAAVFLTLSSRKWREKWLA